MANSSEQDNLKKFRRAAKRYIKRLIKAGELPSADNELLALFIDHYTIWCTAIAAIDEQGITIETPRGFRQKHPALSIADSEAKILVKVANELGISARGKKALGEQLSRSDRKTKDDLLN